jgi:hypothetical protein
MGRQKKLMINQVLYVVSNKYAETLYKSKLKYISKDFAYLFAYYLQKVLTLSDSKKDGRNVPRLWKWVLLL